MREVAKAGPQRMSEIQRSLVASPRLRHLRHASSSEALLQRDLECGMAIPIAEFFEHRGWMSTIRREENPIAGSMSIEQIVDEEVDRGPGSRPVLDEGGHIGTAIEIRVELVGPIEGEALVVAH